MNLFRFFPAAIATIAVVLGSVCPAKAVQPLDGPDDIDGICQYSNPQYKVVSGGGSEAGNGRSSHDYQSARRTMAQKVMEITVSAEQLALIGYDHITGLLSISGFRDYPLFSGRHFLRLREGGALHFEVDEELARDWTARVRMGGAGLKIGFMLSAHDDYEQAFCEAQKGDSNQSVAGGAETGVTGPLRQVVLADLLYATLIDADGKALSTFHSALGHRTYLRNASQVDGQKKASIPRVEVTSLVWTGASSPVTVATSTEAIESDHPPVETAERTLDSWWRSAIEAAVYPCYQRGLARNGRLQGAFVMRMTAANLSNSAAETLLDTLQMDDVSSCILERVRAIRMPSNDNRRWTSVKATLLFMLD